MLGYTLQSAMKLAKGLNESQNEEKKTLGVEYPANCPTLDTETAARLLAACLIGSMSRTTEAWTKHAPQPKLWFQHEPHTHAPLCSPSKPPKILPNSDFHLFSLHEQRKF
jgi:hypothetical protein